MSDLAAAWDPAPIVLVGACLALLVFVRAFVRLRRRGRVDHAGWCRLALFLLALAVGTLPLVSPLDEVGDSDLLSAHMLEHVLIADVAPALALLALRGPLLFFVVSPVLLRPLARCPRIRHTFAFVLRPGVSLTIWLLVIASWHVPAAYDFALSHEMVHHVEHLSFVGAGLLVWMQIVDPARRGHLRHSQRLGYMFLLVGASGVLATVLAAAPAPLYPSYAEPGGHLLGLSDSQDQQLAAMTMLVEQVASLSVCWAFLLRARVAPTRARTRTALETHPARM